jgi:hypothetical protein
MLKVWSGLAILGFTIAANASAGAAPQPSAQTVMQHVLQNQNVPRTFRAQTSMQLKQRNFPWASEVLSGTSYFEAPNHLTVKFTNLPGFMRGLPKAYAKVLNVGAWPQEYNVSLGGMQTVNGHTDYVLELTPKSPQSTDHGLALVNPSDWTVEQVSWSLAGGVTLNMTEHYAQVASYKVPSAQDLTVKTPYATADGNATLRDYALNVPIDSQVFSQG